MKTNLHRHLQGIFKILKSRFDYINHSIGHNLTKGEENEEEIRKLLIEFLPPQYGVGSGIIVDIEGNESKQVDIIIFDKSIPNYTLSKESKIFLVDQVLATIEIKTTFTKSSLKEALKNTESIKRLVSSPLTWVEPVSIIEDETHQKWKPQIFSPQPPLSFIFFYTIPKTKGLLDIDIFFDSLKEEINKYDKKMQPNILFSLAHSSFFRYVDLAQKEEGKYHPCLVNLEDNPKSQVSINTGDDIFAIFDFGDNRFSHDNYFDGKEICDHSGKKRIFAMEGEEISIDPLVYRTAKVKAKNKEKETFLIDSYRGFISFIYQIDWMLRIKKTNKNGFIKDYFPERFFHLTNYDDGLVFEEDI